MKKIIGLAAVARSGKDTVASILLSNSGVEAYALADPLKAGCQHLFGLTDAQAWDDSYKEVVIPLWGRSPRQLFQEVGTEWMRNHNPEFWLMRADREINGPQTPPPPFLAQTWQQKTDFISMACCEFFGFTTEQMLHPALSKTPDSFWGVEPDHVLSMIRHLTLQSFPDWEKLRPLANNQLSSSFETKLESANVIIIKDIRFENEASYIRHHNGTIWHIIRPDAKKVNTHTSEAGIKILPEDITIMNDGSIEQLRETVNNLWNHHTRKTEK